MMHKVISTHSQLMSTICCDAVLQVADPEKHTLDLRDIQIVAKVGGTLDNTELVDGLCLDQAAMGTTRRMEKAKGKSLKFHFLPQRCRNLKFSMIQLIYSCFDSISTVSSQNRHGKSGRH